MLGALRLVARRPVPVLGVNLGNLGFLVEVEPEELPAALDRLERRRLHDRAAQRGCGSARPATRRSRSTTSRSCACPATASCEATLAVGGQRMGRYRCDGAGRSRRSIGSTAYAYSAGGPVVSPGARRGGRRRARADGGHQPRRWSTAADEPIRLTLQEGSGLPGDRGRRHDAAPHRARRGARRAAARPAAARSCGSTATATSAATRSSSACSTCRSSRRSSATCGPTSATRPILADDERRLEHVLLERLIEHGPAVLLVGCRHERVRRPLITGGRKSVETVKSNRLPFLESTSRLPVREWIRISCSRNGSPA